MPCGSLYWSEDIGCFVSEDLLSREREIHSSRTENRQKARNKTAREAETGLFEDIGTYFHLSSQAEQVEAEDETGSLEGFADCQEGIQAQGHTRVAFYEKDLRKVFER